MPLMNGDLSTDLTDYEKFQRSMTSRPEPLTVPMTATESSIDEYREEALPKSKPYPHSYRARLYADSSN